MQKNPGELDGEDRLTHRRWTIAFSVFYGAVFIAFASLVIMHPPITDEIVAKVEGHKVAGPVTLASKKADAR